jgi:hypothetical protein
VRSKRKTFPKREGASTARNAGHQATRQDTRRCEAVCDFYLESTNEFHKASAKNTRRTGPNAVEVAKVQSSKVLLTVHSVNVRYGRTISQRVIKPLCS